MNFSWWTFTLQAANFLILVWLLQHFLFKPVKAMVARRREEISCSLREASAERETAGRLKQEIEDQKSRIEAERQRLLQEQNVELSAQRQAILEQARGEAEKLKTQVLAELNQERTAAMSELFEHSAQLAIALAERLLRELAVTSLDRLFLARMLDYLDHLPGNHPSALSTPPDSHLVVVTTAHPIAVDEQGEWRDGLTKRIGANSIQFKADPALIAGAKIELADSIVSFNWRDTLETAKKELANLS